MFIETINKLVAEFQQRLATDVSVPWGWIFTKLATLLSRYPTGVTRAIMFAELECSWRKIEKLHAKGQMHAADSLRSIFLSKQLSPQAVFEVFLKEVKNVEGTHTRIAVLEESDSSEDESGFTMEMYLHQKLYNEVEEVMANGYKLRFTGCRLFDSRKKKPSRLLPSESFVVLVDDEAIKNSHNEFTTLEGLDQCRDSQYINSIIKVKVCEIGKEEAVHYPDGQSANSVNILVTDDVGILAKFHLWEEYLVIANLLEAGDMLYIKKCFLVPDSVEYFMLEYGPETIIFCRPQTHVQEVLPSQRDCSRMLHVLRNNKGVLDCSMYPERLGIAEVKQNMTNIILCGQVVFVGEKKIQRGEGVDMVRYEIRVEDETGVCCVVVVEPYKGGTVLYCGQFVLMKNLLVSTDYTMGVTLHLNTDKDGELWNLSSLQGWLATSSLCAISPLTSLSSESSPRVVKGIISHIQARDRSENVVRIHCSCQGELVEDLEGQLRCENCQAQGMVEIPVHGTPKLFNLDGFWCWQYSLCIIILESENHQIQVNITNEVGEKLLQLPARQLHALGRDGQRRVFEYTLGQECFYGLSSFKGSFLVNFVNHI